MSGVSGAWPLGEGPSDADGAGGASGALGAAGTTDAAGGMGPGGDTRAAAIRPGYGGAGGCGAPLPFGEGGVAGGDDDGRSVARLISRWRRPPSGDHGVATLKPTR